ncbi:MAG: LysM peptidoglycan-binding domain-containing protein [Bauldia sp.]|nr:LysM peptidoglycan-binding domain-containing protein [Bauldia sp.]
MRRALQLLIVLVLFLTPSAASISPAIGGSRDQAQPEPVVGTVYVFRPMGGRIATAEMDKIASKLKARGIAAEVHNYTDWLRPANAAIARYKKESWKSAIIAIGHSAGGDSTLRFATWLRRSGVPVNLIITLDPTRIARPVPSNVQRFINIYSSDNTLGGGDPKPARDFKGHFASVDLKNYPGEWHLYLPNTLGLQDAVIDKILSEAEQPEPVKDGGVRIAYAMPRGVPIVLYDSGVVVAAEAGETPAGIAARYGVPAWAVSAVNNIEPDRGLPAGQRIVVPHNLDSPPAQ